MEIIRRVWYGSRMRYSKDYKETSRRKIVGVAAREFLRHGISGFRVNDVMKGAGLNAGSFLRPLLLEGRTCEGSPA